MDRALNDSDQSAFITSRSGRFFQLYSHRTHDGLIMAQWDFAMSTPPRESPIEHYPCWSVVARVCFSANPSVYAPVDEPLARSGREKEMIQAHPLVQGPPIALVIPERPERTLGLQLSQSVRPALG